jgi:hypothetical protein
MEKMTEPSEGFHRKISIENFDRALSATNTKIIENELRCNLNLSAYKVYYKHAIDDG